MNSDPNEGLDIDLQRRLRGGVERIPVLPMPARHLAGPERRVVPLVTAIFVMAALGLFGGRAIAELRSRVGPGSGPSDQVVLDGYRVGSCATTAVTPWVVAGPYSAAQYDAVIGGRLATYAKRNLIVGDRWFIVGPPMSAIELQVERLDRPAAPFTLIATGFEGGRMPAPWDAAWEYRTSVDAVSLLPPPPGCWSVHLVGGTAADTVIIETVGSGVPGPRQP